MLGVPFSDLPIQAGKGLGGKGNGGCGDVGGVVAGIFGCVLREVTVGGWAVR